MTTATAAAPSAPGYFLDVPNDAYHAGPGVSKSQLDLIHEAPALLEWSRKAPRDDQARAAVDIGDALHAIALEPDRFNDEFTVEFRAPADAITSIDDLKLACDERAVPYTSKDTKGSLQRKLLEVDPDAPVLDRLREQFLHEAKGRTILTAEEHRKLLLMRDSIMAYPDARMLLEAAGDVEPSIYWTDPETGELCRCRPDKRVVLRGTRWHLDVKTTESIERFQWSIEDYRYHVQDAFYSEGEAQHFGSPPDFFAFLVVSTHRSAGRFPVRLFMLDAHDKAMGRKLMREDLNRYAECRRRNRWPGITTITRPDRVRRDELAAAS